MVKKLLIVTDAWTPQVNGVVTTLQKTKEIMEKRGYEVRLIEPSQFHSVPLPFYPEIRLSLFPRHRVKKTIGDFAPDFIHIATEGPLGFSARGVCMRTGLRFTTSYHTNFDLYADLYIGKISKIVILLLRWFHKPAHATLVATPTLKALLEKRGFQHIELWPLGVDTEMFKPSIDSPVANLTKPVFTLFGRLAKDKNPEEFFTLKLPGTKLVIGDGPEREHLEKKYAGHATFVGFKEQNELVRWLSLTDVLIFTSRDETFGLTIVEALACGIPVAAHNAMGPKDIITSGVDGWIGDDLEVASKKCLSLDRKMCRATALRFNWNSSIDAFEKNLVRIDINRL